MRFLAATLFLLFPILAGSVAAPEAYAVEILVFEHRLPDLEGGELWTRMDTGIVEHPVDTVIPRVTSVTPGLDEAAQALGKDARYRILTHARWVQNAESRDTARPVAVATAASKELDGIVRLYVSRFLHLELNLAFQPTDGPGLLHRIDEQRRVKTQELHYFDHPKFGALVRVAPAAVN